MIHEYDTLYTICPPTLKSRIEKLFNSFGYIPEETVVCEDEAQFKEERDEQKLLYSQCVFVKDSRKTWEERVAMILLSSVPMLCKKLNSLSVSKEGLVEKVLILENKEESWVRIGVVLNEAGAALLEKNTMPAYYMD